MLAVALTLLLLGAPHPGATATIDVSAAPSGARRDSHARSTPLR